MEESADLLAVLGTASETGEHVWSFTPSGVARVNVLVPTIRPTNQAWRDAGRHRA
jgi:hypothetical protein